ncbi:S49 family peptidase, partial [Candidatus Poribacteria bacterium]|nr:S49 family peptidase [Candidatus Poribacteria bacterium]
MITKYRKSLSILIVVCAVLISLPTFAQEGDVKPGRKYVEMSIGGSLTEVKAPFALNPTVKTMRNITEQIDRIRRDNAVTGVLLKIEGLDIGWAKLQEIRDQIIQLRRDGKKVISYLEGPDNAEYLLACATDEIVLMPAGTIGLTGLRAEVTFYKGLLEKLDIKADIRAIGKYKSAVEPYTR